jgi:acetyl-CoA carboxylase biotin carboxyl carrier protein
MTGSDQWTPEGVSRVIETARRSGVRSFKLETASVKLEIDFGDAVPVLEQPPLASTIDAPMLGTFYRRSDPEAPLLAEVGDLISAGQTIGLIEVMKTYNEVTSPRAGKLSAFLVEDGQFVEYGQGLATLDPV